MKKPISYYIGYCLTLAVAWALALVGLGAAAKLSVRLVMLGWRAL